MSIVDANWLAILPAAIASWLLGAVWYGVLGKPWMAALGVTQAELLGPSGKPSPVPFILSFLAEIVMALILSGIIGHVGPPTVKTGLISGALCWLGFVATTLVVNNAYAKRRPMLSLIDGGHWLAVLLVQGAVIGWLL
jgi:hypothetical protein